MVKRRRRGLWSTIRRIWVTTGVVATIVFVSWSLWAYRASAAAHQAMASDERVVVSEREHHWTFMPTHGARPVGLLFFPGALVDPIAYAPLLRGVAEAGYAVILVQVPRRGAFGGAEGSEPLTRGIDATLTVDNVGRWVAAGHSRGGEIASRLARTNAPSLAGLLLIGTSHPRDIDLSRLKFPVTRIYGTRDTVADVEKLERTKVNLPRHTRHVRIDGGNHSQFGAYGFQPGDWAATIRRAEQQRHTLEATLALLKMENGKW